MASNTKYNTILYRQRKELKLTRKKVAFDLHLFPLELLLIERGYLQVPKRKEQSFIKYYGLSEDFFSNQLGYPSDNFAEKKEKVNFLTKIISKSWMKIVYPICFVIFALMCTAGVIGQKDAMEKPKQYYDQDYLYLLEEQVLNNPDSQAGGIFHLIPTLLGDRYYSLTNEDQIYEKNLDEVSINVFTLDENIDYTFFGGKISTYFDDVKYSLAFESRCLGGIERIKCTFYEKDFVLNHKIAYVSADYDYQKADYKFNYVQTVDDNNQIHRIDDDHPDYQFIVDNFKDLIPKYLEDVKNMFENGKFISIYYEDGMMNYETFKYKQNIGVNKSNNHVKCNYWHAIIGSVFGVGFLALAIAAMFYSPNHGSKLEAEITDNNFIVDEIIIDKQASKIEKKKLKKNWRFPPLLPETFIRLAALAFMGVASIMIFVIFQGLIDRDFILAPEKFVQELYLRDILNTFLIASVLLNFFTKIDVDMRNKNVYRSNYIMLFFGILFYFFLILLKYTINLSQGFMTGIGNLLLNLLPGNIIFAVLSIKTIIMFLFVTPKKCENNHKKLIMFRLSALLPLAYLVTSCVLSILKKNGMNIPYEVYCLFFSKSLILVVFALFYVGAIYIYSLFLRTHYNKQDYQTYLLGNKYYFIKNIIAAVIVGIIAISDVILGKVIQNGPISFGNNWYIVFIIPLILLYHPHVGKRNYVKDSVVGTLNMLAVSIGYLLIIASLSNYFFSI